MKWIVHCTRYLRDFGFTTNQAWADSEVIWVQSCYDPAKDELFAEVCNSWFFGYGSSEGDRRPFLMFREGVPAYRHTFADMTAYNYEGF